MNSSRSLSRALKVLGPNMDISSNAGGGVGSRRPSHAISRSCHSATVQFTAAAAYPACQEAVRHLSNSRDGLIFFQIFLYKPV